MASLPCIRSLTLSRRAPSLPPGWKTRKSEAVKPRRSSSATASASPSASWMRVDVVGASPFGQASSTLGNCSTISAARPSALFGIGGDGDERHGEAAGIIDHVAKLGGLAGPGQGDQHVIRRDHAEIAMAGLGSMHEKRRGAGGGEGGGELAADMPALAHAGDDDPPARILDQPHRPLDTFAERAVQGIEQGGQPGRLDGEGPPQIRAQRRAVRGRGKTRGIFTDGQDLQEAESARRARSSRRVGANAPSFGTEPAAGMNGVNKRRRAQMQSVPAVVPCRSPPSVYPLRPSDAVIEEAAGFHFARPIDVAQVDDDRALERVPSGGRNRARGTRPTRWR